MFFCFFGMKIIKYIVIVGLLALLCLLAVAVLLMYVHDPVPYEQQSSNPQARTEAEAEDALVLPEGIQVISTETAPFNSPGSEALKSQAKIGFITRIESSRRTTILYIDEAKWYSGEEADRVSKREAGCSSQSAKEGCNIPNGLIPNGYYISNPQQTSKRFVLSSGAKIRLIAMGVPDIGLGIKDGTIEDLNAIFIQDMQIKKEAPDYEGTPFWIIADRENIIILEEQYIP